MPDAPGPALTERPPPGAAGELAVYVHWPFCQAKCPYCDFNSHVRRGGVDAARYLAAYDREIAHLARLLPQARVASVFFGGGTPSLMPPATVAGVLDALSARWTIADEAEITLEANPTSVEAARFAGYRAAGVNRVSLGIQSLEDAALARLGRLHSARDARAALDVARAHFERVSFDLIYARPGQTEADWERELGEALRLADGHISLYQLTIEPGTPFAALHQAGRLRPPGGETSARLYELTGSMTEAAGYAAYEISNHARAGQACRHNLLVWRGGDYAGIGPGAHGRIPVEGRRHATDTLKTPEAWLAAVETCGHGLSTCRPLPPREVAEEYLLLSLRLAEGLDPVRYEALGGPPLERARLATLEREELVTTAGGRLAATSRGRLVLDSLIAALAA